MGKITTLVKGMFKSKFNLMIYTIILVMAAFVFINVVLYSSSSSIFRRIQSGLNDVASAVAMDDDEDVLRSGISWRHDPIDSTFANGDIIDFEGFNNENATENQTMIVPNIVHLIYMEKNKLRFHEMICILSIYLNQKPSAIIIHCENCTFFGPFWRKLQKVDGLRKILHMSVLPVKRTIFGQKGNWPVFHRGDYWRNLILMEYGGIYLDNDVYVIRSLDYFRKFEMSVGLGNLERYTIGSQVLVAHKNARLLKAWFDSYRSNYKKNEWYTNAGQVPGHVIRNHSYIAHLELEKFGVGIGTYNLYQRYWPEWRNMYTYHLLMNHRSYLDKDNFKLVKEFDALNVRTLNTTFTEMCCDILDRIQKEVKLF